MTFKNFTQQLMDLAQDYAEDVLQAKAECELDGDNWEHSFDVEVNYIFDGIHGQLQDIFYFYAMDLKKEIGDKK